MSDQEFLLVDGHLDLAFNAMLGRDLRLDLQTLRDTDPVPHQTASICFSGLKAAGLRVCFGTLFACPEALPLSAVFAGYTNPEEARKQALWQLQQYQTWHQEGQIRLLRNRQELEQHLAQIEVDDTLGVVLLMEGADPIKDLADLAFWVEAGVRIIGPAWKATRYAGGTDTPGPLTTAGQDLIREMKRLDLTVDVSHLDDAAFWESVRIGPKMIASHSNSRTLVPHNRPVNRQITDEMATAIVDTEGVIGLVFLNKFFSPHWKDNDPRVSWEPLIQHVEHFVALCGEQHLGIGSDLDGGFGLEKMPLEIERYQDILKFLNCLSTERRVDFAGRNWISWLKHNF